MFIAPFGGGGKGVMAESVDFPWHALCDIIDAGVCFRRKNIIASARHQAAKFDILFHLVIAQRAQMGADECAGKNRLESWVV